MHCGAGGRSETRSTGSGAHGRTGRYAGSRIGILAIPLPKPAATTVASVRVRSGSRILIP